MSRQELRKATRGMKSVYMDVEGHRVAKPAPNTGAMPPMKPKLKLMPLIVRYALYIGYGTLPGNKLLT